MKRLILVASTVLLTAACGSKHKGSYENTTAQGETVISPMSPELDLQKAEDLWALRADATKLQESLDLYAAVAQNNPSNTDALLRLVRGYYFLGDAHKTELDDKLAAWNTAISFGKQCMGRNDTFTSLLEKGEGEDEAARALEVSDVPCTYWTAAALGKWAKSQGLGTTLKNIPIAKAWMTRINELDGTYFYGGADRYWGAYYAAVPSFAGQDLPLSREYFDKAISAHPNHFGNHVLLADYWATRTQDIATFDQQLKFVLSQPVDVIPDLIPEQEAEQRKARALMAQRDELFLQ
jgi:hypothetical protein